MKRLPVLPLAVLLGGTLALPASGRAERTQVYSIQGIDCADCSNKIRKELEQVAGVRKVEFDQKKVELTVRLDDAVEDAQVTAAAERAGLKAVVGPGQGAYLPVPGYPAGADVVRLTNSGQKMGPLRKLRVPGKHTVFDVYADWCGPCGLVDEALRSIASRRSDVAVRKLNVVDFDSPLAQELGSDFEALPYVVVFSPSGKRTAIRGANLEALAEALRQP